MKAKGLSAICHVMMAKTRLLTPSLAEFELQCDPHRVLTLKRQRFEAETRRRDTRHTKNEFEFRCRIISKKKHERENHLLNGSGRTKISFLPHHHDKVQGRLLAVRNIFECQIPWIFDCEQSISHFSFHEPSDSSRAPWSTSLVRRLSTSTLSRRVTLNLANPLKKITAEKNTEIFNHTHRWATLKISILIRISAIKQSQNL